MAEISSHMASWGFVGATSFTELECYQPFRQLSTELRCIFLDACNVAAFFTQGYRMDPHVLQETIVSFGYRLVRFHPVGGPILCIRVDSICHIGLTALMTTFFFQIGRRRLLQYELVGRHLKAVATAGFEGVDVDVRLWLLIIGGVSVLPEREEDWLFANIQETARSGCIQSWEDVHSRISRFPWIPSLHDEEAQRLWNSAMRLG